MRRLDTEAVDGKYLPEVVNRFFAIVSVQKVAAQLLLDGLGIMLSALVGMAVLCFSHPWLLGVLFALGPQAERDIWVVRHQGWREISLTLASLPPGYVVELLRSRDAF